MPVHSEKPSTVKNRINADVPSGKQNLSDPTLHLQDNRPEANVQREFREIVNSSPVQRKGKTGLPDALKSGLENQSGYSLDDVRVHYNSGKPAQLQAHAYAQGSDIHLGRGQEKHLPHEAWHVIQQKQGRVKPTMQLSGGVNVNDDKGLEREADVMGMKSLQSDQHISKPLRVGSSSGAAVSQGKFAEDVKINQVSHLVAQFPEELEGLNFQQKNTIYIKLAKAEKVYQASEIPGAIRALRSGSLSAEPVLEKEPPLVAKSPAMSKPAVATGSSLGKGSTPSRNPYSKPESSNTKGISNTTSPGLKEESNFGSSAAPKTEVLPENKDAESVEKAVEHAPGKHNIKASEESFENNRNFLIPKFLSINNLIRGDTRSKEAISLAGFQPGTRVEGYHEQLISFLNSISDIPSSEKISKDMKNRERGIAINPTAKRHHQIDLVWSEQKIEVSGGRTITLLNYVCTGPASGAGGNDYMIKVDEVLECISASPTIALYQAKSGMQILAMASSAGKPGSFPVFHEYDFLTPIPADRIYYCSKDGGSTQTVTGGDWFNLVDKSPR